MHPVSNTLSCIPRQVLQEKTTAPPTRNFYPVAGAVRIQASADYSAAVLKNFIEPSKGLFHFQSFFSALGSASYGMPAYS